MMAENNGDATKESSFWLPNDAPEVMGGALVESEVVADSLPHHSDSDSEGNNILEVLKRNLDREFLRPASSSPSASSTMVNEVTMGSSQQCPQIQNEPEETVRTSSLQDRHYGVAR